MYQDHRNEWHMGQDQAAHHYGDPPRTRLEVASLGPQNFTDEDMHEADRLNEEYAKAETARWQKEKDAMAQNDKPKPDDGGFEDWWRGQQQPDPGNWNPKERRYDEPQDTPDDHEKRQRAMEDARRASHHQPDNAATSEEVEDRWNDQARRSASDDDYQGREYLDPRSYPQNEDWPGIRDGVRGNGAPNSTNPKKQTGEANKSLTDDTDATRHVKFVDQMFGAAEDRLPAPGVAPETARKSGRGR